MLELPADVLAWIIAVGFAAIFGAGIGAVA
jgi:hypothetical protein